MWTDAGSEVPDERPPAWPKHAADFDQASDPLDERAEQKPAQGVVDASVAGVGRVTLYGHFPSRQKLLDAVFAHALAKADTALHAEVIDHGAASEALSRLIRSSWPILAQHRGLLAAAQRDLPPARIGQHHDQTMAPSSGSSPAARTRATCVPTCPAPGWWPPSTA